MKAAILKATENLVIEEREIPQAQAGEIIVKVAYTGICRTDRKAYHMSQQDLIMPRVLGHEICGVIHQIGLGVTGYEIGEKVQVHPGIGCGTCEDCKNHNDQVCQKMQILGFHIDGGFQEYCRIPQEGVNRGIVQKMPQNLPMEQGVLCEPLACIVNIFTRIQPQKHQKILLHGGGALGLLGATYGKLKGIDKVLILEKDASKIEIAKNLGFLSLPHDAEEEEIIKALGGSPDIAIPCCPDNDAVAVSLKILKKRGTFGFFSGLTSNQPLDRNTLNLIHYKELAVYGAYGCGLHHGKEALKLLGEHPEAFRFPTTMISLENLENTLQSLEITDTIFKAVKF